MGTGVWTSLGPPQGLLGALASGQSPPAPAHHQHLTLEDVKALQWETPKLHATFAGHRRTHHLYRRFLHELVKVNKTYFPCALTHLHILGLLQPAEDSTLQSLDKELFHLEAGWPRG